MIVKGDMSYDISGRKKRSLTKRSYRDRDDKPLVRQELPAAYRVDKYPSHQGKAHTTSVRSFPKSDGYTIAPAYNKGAYQVIPKDDIQHIGK